MSLRVRILKNFFTFFFYFLRIVGFFITNGSSYRAYTSLSYYCGFSISTLFASFKHSFYPLSSDEESSSVRADSFVVCSTCFLQLSLLLNIVSNFSFALKPPTFGHLKIFNFFVFILFLLTKLPTKITFY